jgi:hypothetical protein
VDGAVRPFVIFRVLWWARIRGNEALGISAQAVEEHRESFIKKTGLLSQAELTKLRVQPGLIQASGDGSLRGGGNYLQPGGEGELALALVEGDKAFQPQLQCAGHMQHIE